MKIQENKDRFFVSIPKVMIKKKGWKKGQEVCASFDQDGNIVIMEV